MTTRFLPSAVYQKNRKKFSERLLPKSIAIFNSNDIYPVSADSTLPFAQHRDILYLTGVDQEESILVLFPDAYQSENREILFLRETNEHIAIWEGHKLTKEEATERTGIENIQWLSEFPKMLASLMIEAEHVYLNINEHYRSERIVETREERFIKELIQRYPLHHYHRSNPILQYLRSVKEEEEIQMIQTACDITERAFRRLLPFVRPGVWEYEIQAEIIHEFIKSGSKGFAYTPIVASGVNSNVLHYIQNDQLCKDGDVVLLDFGAEFGYYASDLTRVLPVSGKFSPRQKEIYNAVLKVKEEATQLLVPGNNWYDYHKEVGKIMTSTLIDLKLLTKEEVQNENPKWPAYKKYFMHGTSHHLGLDTHDYGDLKLPFEPNMVFTVEPGIYLPQEGFGIRLEDDVVVQPSGSPKNLMKNIPIQVEEIESLMNS